MHPLLAYLSMHLKVKLAYRGDFAFNALGDVVVTTVGLFLVATIFTHVPEVRGYDVYEVLVCWGFAESSLGVFWVLFQGLYAVNRQYILGGDLDRLLLRPLDPYLQILLDHLHWEDVPVLGLGLLVLSVGMSGLDAGWSAERLLLLPVFIGCGALVIGGCLTAVTAMGFWMHHQGSAIGLAYQLTVYGRYPLDFLPRPLAVFVSTVLPFAFAGFIPATWYMDRPEWHGLALLQPVIGMGCMAAGYSFWMYSLRRYASTGT